MRRRTFEEMITYFNQTVSEMDINRKYKMTLLGMVTALLQRHDEDVAQIVRCKDCKYNTTSKKCLQPDSFFLVPADDFYCGYAERRTDDSISD